MDPFNTPLSPACPILPIVTTGLMEVNYVLLDSFNTAFSPA